MLCEVGGYFAAIVTEKFQDGPRGMAHSNNILSIFLPFPTKEALPQRGRFILLTVLRSSISTTTNGGNSSRSF